MLLTLPTMVAAAGLRMFNTLAFYPELATPSGQGAYAVMGRVGLVPLGGIGFWCLLFDVDCYKSN